MIIKEKYSSKDGKYLTYFKTKQIGNLHPYIKERKKIDSKQKDESIDVDNIVDHC